jgi:hypothetical protein
MGPSRCKRCTNYGKQYTRTTANYRNRNTVEAKYQELINRTQIQAAAFCQIVHQTTERDTDIARDFGKSHLLDQDPDRRVANEA